MKRALLILLAVCVASAFAGWALAWAHASYRMRDFNEKEKLAALIETKRPAKYFASLVREADEVVISYRDEKGEREARFSDQVWLSRLSDIVEGASYTNTSHGLWISSPEVWLYRDGVQILNLMTLGKVLRSYGEQECGDFIVGEQTTNAILALAQEKDPERPIEPKAKLVTPKEILGDLENVRLVIDATITGVEKVSVSPKVIAMRWVNGHLETEEAEWIFWDGVYPLKTDKGPISVSPLMAARIKKLLTSAYLYKDDGYRFGGGYLPIYRFTLVAANHTFEVLIIGVYDSLAVFRDGKRIGGRPDNSGDVSALRTELDAILREE